jgi:hypothetical protein
MDTAGADTASTVTAVDDITEVADTLRAEVASAVAVVVDASTEAVADVRMAAAVAV